MVRPDGATTVPSAIIVQGIAAGTVTLMLDVSTESVTSLAAKAGDAVLKAMAGLMSGPWRFRAQGYPPLNSPIPGTNVTNGLSENSVSAQLTNPF